MGARKYGRLNGRAPTLAYSNPHTLLTRDIEKLLCYYACEYGELTGCEAAGRADSRRSSLLEAPRKQAVLINLRARKCNSGGL